LGNTSVGTVKTSGDIIVKGNRGIVRSASSAQQVVIVETITVQTTIDGVSAKTFPFSFSQYLNAPSAFVGDILPGGSGTPGVNMYITGVTGGIGGSHGILNVYNAGLLPANFNLQVHVIIIGTPLL